MPLPTITDGFYCAYQYTLASAQSAENTFSITTPTADPETIANALIDAWAAGPGLKMSHDVALKQCSVTPLDGISAATVLASTHVGSAGGGAVADSLALVTTLRTGIAGRANRGRIYWPGVTVDRVNGDRYRWTSDGIAEWSDAMADWVDSFASSSLTLGVLSRTESSFRAVTSTQVQERICTQRRRLTGGLIF